MNVCYNTQSVGKTEQCSKQQTTLIQALQSKMKATVGLNSRRYHLFYLAISSYCHPINLKLIYQRKNVDDKWGQVHDDT